MRIAVAALLLALAAAAAAEEGAAPAPPGPLQVSEIVYNAGRIDRGDPVRHTFLLKNVGTAELKVDAKPG
jgi:hypothetical protein